MPWALAHAGVVIRGTLTTRGVVVFLAAGRVGTALLIPLVMEMPPAERAALVAKADALARFGFEVEEFGVTFPRNSTQAPRVLYDRRSGR